MFETLKNGLLSPAIALLVLAVIVLAFANSRGNGSSIKKGAASLLGGIASAWSAIPGVGWICRVEISISNGRIRRLNCVRIQFSIDPTSHVSEPYRWRRLDGHG